MTKKQTGTDWYWEVLISCSKKSFELISYYLFENGASGIEEVSENYTSSSGRVFFPSSVVDPVALINGIRIQINKKGEKNLKIEKITRKLFQNWQDEWQSFFKPIEIGASFLIRPPWESRVLGKKEIVIQPGQGFGTGYHESTHLALLLLEWALTQQSVQTVLDIGSGSGILSIAALLLGAQRLVAIDIDRDALAEIPNNLELSGLSGFPVDLIQCGPEAINNPAELVIANIEGHFLEKMADDLVRLTHSGGRLVLSGVLTENKESLLNALRPHLVEINSFQLNEWSGFVLQKPH